MRGTHGAIVITIFNIIKSLGKLEDWFDADVVYLTYWDFKKNKNKNEILERIRKNHKKHHRSSQIATFDSEAKIKGWLNKHTCRKPEFWFKEKEGKFIFKRELLYKLEPYDYNL